MPLLFLAIPLFTVMVLNLPFRDAGRKIAFSAAITVTFVQMFMALTAGSTMWLGAGSVLKAQFAVTLTADFLSTAVLFLIGLLAFVSLIINRSLNKTGNFNFINLVLLIVAAMNGITIATDMFSLYVFLEAVSAASFILIAVNREKPGLEGAFKYFMLSAIATVLILSSIAFIFMLTGGTDFTAVNEYISGLSGDYPLQITIAFVLFTAGVSVKAGLVPFHDWVPDVYSSSPAPVSVLLAGIVTKVCGVYTIMRIFKDVFSAVPAVGNVLIILGLLSIVIGALAALGQNDFKRMLAYCSISQIGYIILGIATGSVLGFIGALFHFFNHSIFKSLLFVDSAAIEQQTGTRDMNRMGGLAAVMPATGTSSVIAFLSTAGIPPLSGFWSKLLIIIAIWRVSVISAVIALLASIITLAYLLVMQKKVFFGKLPPGFQNIKECSRSIVGIELMLSVITVISGVLFPVILKYMQVKGLI